MSPVEINFNPEADYLVKESKTMNIVIGIILLAIFIISLAAGDYGWSNYMWALFLFLIPAAISMVKARTSPVFIIINKSGFIYKGKLLFNWDYFIDAILTQDKKPGSLSDNFIILIRYYSKDRSLIYTSRIPMSNTQDKADEEIIAAIDFYYNASREQLLELVEG